MNSPQTPIEAALSGIWSSAFQTETPGSKGLRLKAERDRAQIERLRAALRAVFQVELPQQDPPEGWTLDGVSAWVQQALHPEPAGATAPGAPALHNGDARRLPLSLSQERMWFIQQLQPESTAYNIAGGGRIQGALQIELLKESLRAIVRRHEVLRARFALEEGEPWQWVAPDVDLPLEVVDLTPLPAPERYPEALRRAQEEVRRRFNLDKAPLMRLHLYRLEEQDFLFVLNFHHLITDAWSLGLFARELFAGYAELAAGQPVQLPELPAQYGDFVLWQRRHLQGDRLGRQIDYWKGQLQGVEPVSLPTDRPRPAVQTSNGARCTCPISKELLDSLKQLSINQGATLFMTLLAAFFTLMHRYTGEEDLTIGVPIANRNWYASERLLGAFVNTLVLRARLSGGLTFRELLAQVQKTALEAYSNQDVPFAQLVQELQPKRDTSRPPFFTVMFNVVNVEMPAFEWDGRPLEPVELDPSGAQFDLTLTIVDTRALQSIVIEYNRDLYSADTISHMLDHYLTLLSSILEDTGEEIGRLPLLSAGERQKLLVKWNATRRDFPYPTSITAAFEAQVERAPQAAALVEAGKPVSYGELNARANRLARLLQAAGVRPGDCVGVCLPRSADLIASLLAALKTGAAYVPLDPAYPVERLAFMRQDAGTALVLTDRGLASAIPEYPGEVLDLGAVSEELARHSPENPPRFSGWDADPERLAYIIYTSGSTGQPKGVACPQGGLLNRVYWMWETFPFQPGEVCCQKTPLGFVDSVWEIFGPLLAGVPSVLVPEDAVKDPAWLVPLLAQERVTRLVLVPSLLGALLERFPDLGQRLPHLWLWTCSGESLSQELCRRFHQALPGRTLLNLYGMSEAAGDSTVHVASPTEEGGLAPIGRPIANTSIYLLDEGRQLAPIGAPGEIYIGGRGLAQGYWNRPDLTAERFIPNPFSEGPEARLFRSGDRGRFLPDGTLQYLGRADRQVKVRGVRVELDEVEAALRQHPCIRQAAVVAQGAGEVTRLVAYVELQEITNGETAPVSASDWRLALRGFLSRRLPEPMLPGQWVRLERLPLTPSGKIDRRSLPETSPVEAQLPPVEEPGDEMETELVEIWKSILKLPQVGLRQNFFELGGHSLLAVRLVSRIEAATGRKLPLEILFQAPTIAELAAALRLSQGEAAGQGSLLVPLQSRGSLAPLFLVHGFGGGLMGYGELVRLLGPERPVYGLRARGLEGEGEPHRDFREMARDYVEAVRRAQPQGPYALAGYCYGGVVAYEMACQLHRQGETISFLGVIDGVAPVEPGWSLGNLAGDLRFLRNAVYWMGELVGQAEGMAAQFGRRLRFYRKQLQKRRGRAGQLELEDFRALAADIPPAHQRVFLAELEAQEGYVPQAYPGKVTLFRTQTQWFWAGHDPYQGWMELAAGGVDLVMVAGPHTRLMQQPFVQSLAAQVKESLEKA
jgi:amino acid adenylation domain-containing protein